MIFSLGVNIRENKQMSLWEKQQIVSLKMSLIDKKEEEIQKRTQQMSTGKLGNSPEEAIFSEVKPSTKQEELSTVHRNMRNSEEQNIMILSRRFLVTLDSCPKDGAPRVITITWWQKEAAESCQGDLVALKSIYEMRNAREKLEGEPESLPLIVIEVPASLTRWMRPAEEVPARFSSCRMPFLQILSFAWLGNEWLRS